jgi:hypothetical protein
MLGGQRSARRLPAEATSAPPIANGVAAGRTPRWVVEPELQALGDGEERRDEPAEVEEGRPARRARRSGSGTDRATRMARGVRAQRSSCRTHTTASSAEREVDARQPSRVPNSAISALPVSGPIAVETAMIEQVQRVAPALKEHRGAEDPVDGARNVDRAHQEHGHAREQQPHHPSQSPWIAKISAPTGKLKRNRSSGSRSTGCQSRRKDQRPAPLNAGHPPRLAGFSETMPSCAHGPPHARSSGAGIRDWTAAIRVR